MSISTGFMLSKLKAMRSGTVDSARDTRVKSPRNAMDQQQALSSSMADVLENCLRPNHQKDNTPQS